MLDKVYQPDKVERKHYAEWEKGHAFACGQAADAEPYTIVIPPPNAPVVCIWDMRSIIPCRISLSDTSV